MLTKRLRVLILLTSLLLVPLANGAKTIVSASATISGSGTSYRLTVRNTGDEPLKCVGLLLDGVQPTAATGPPGVLTRVGTFEGRGLVHMQGDLVVAAGATTTVDFKTNVPIPANAGGDLRYSGTCTGGSDVVSRATGPPPPPQPKPKPKKCECDSLDVELNLHLPDARRQTLFMDWTLECTKGSGSTCRGLLTVELAAASRRAGVRLSAKASPAKAGRPGQRRGTWLVTCEAVCALDKPNAVEGGSGTIEISAPPKEKFGREVGAVTIEVDRFCKRDLTTRVFRVAFNEGGVVSVRRSDLNGNGIADGKEKKK